MKVLFPRLCKTRGPGRGEGSGKVPGVIYGSMESVCGDVVLAGKSSSR